ncbi:MAG: hypothetical protein OEZ25_01085 [Candidatus Bathyarchaeota archaeon]|nr:hypothetical protein [Candidatus Bathyarchaeota archaeon]
MMEKSEGPNSLMEEKFQKFDKGLKEAIYEFERWSPELVYLIHHDDADGLTSAAIAKRALVREKIKTRLICIEKLYPDIVKRLHALSGNVYFYLDIAAAHAKFISEENKGKNLTFILDHHDAEPSTDPLVYNLDPELYGISGERDVSGSATAYVLSRRLNPRNIDVSHLAVIGSAEIPGDLRGINRMVLEDAVKKELVRVVVSTGKESYRITPFKGRSSRSLSRRLTVLGSVGYYRGGPKMGVDACLKGFTSETEAFTDELEEERKKANKRLLAQLYHGGLLKSSNVQWFHARDVFKGMGVKVVGSFCSLISYKTLVDGNKYIFGFMNMDREIPGFGMLEEDYVKVSARVPPKLGKLIMSGKKPPLSKILAEACRESGGNADGHAVAASGWIPRGQKETLVRKANDIISKQLSEE